MAVAFLKKHWPLVALAAITIFAAALRLSLMTESLWIDELHTAWTANGTFGEVFSRAKMGNQGPVYFVAMWLWTHVFGLSEISLRLPSWFAGVALPGVVYWAVRKVDPEDEQGKLVALVASLAAALDFYAIFYSQEARPYAWVMVGSVLHFTDLVCWLRKPERWQMLRLGVGGAVLFQLHFTTALLFAAEIAYAAVFFAFGRQASVTSPAPRPQISLRQLLMLPVLIALCCLPAVSSLQLISERVENWAQFVRRPRWEDLFLTFPAALAILLVLARYAFLWMRRKTDSEQPDETQPITWRLGLWSGLWLFVPLFIAWIASFFNAARIFFPRYLVAALPGSWILLGQGLRAGPTGWQRMQLAAVLIFAWTRQAPLSSVSQAEMRRNENWREAVAYVNAHYDELRGPVFVAADLIERSHSGGQPSTDSYFLLPVLSLYQLKSDDLHIWPPTLGDYTTATQSCWFIARGKSLFPEGETKFSADFGKIRVRGYEYPRPE